MDELTRHGYWQELNPLQQPGIGRRLDVVGFALGDSFEAILRNISEEYLEAAWKHLHRVLQSRSIAANDLSWGWMHPGETGLPDDRARPDITTPSDYIGWLSCDLSSNCETEQIKQLDEELKIGFPKVRCAHTWRSMKWSIAQQDYPTALKLIESICTNEVSDWVPELVLQNVSEPTEVWRQIAKVIQQDDQQQLDALIEEALYSYTAIGLRILLRGYGTYLSSGTHTGKVVLPPIT